MAITVKLMAVTVSFFGLLSFILGVIAENKKVLIIHSLSAIIYFFIFETFLNWTFTLPSIIMDLHMTIVYM